MQDTNTLVSNLTTVLRELQSKIIGIAIVYGMREAILEADAHTLRTIAVHPMLGSSDTHFARERASKVALFPEGTTLVDMLDKGIYLQWCKDNELL